MPRPSPAPAADVTPRRAILDAAAHAFVKAGPHATTVRAIAEEAGLAPSSLYTHFGSKEAIFRALREDVMAEARSVFQRTFPKDLSFRQRLELLLLRQAELVETRRDAFIFAASPAAQDEADSDSQRDYVMALADWVRANSRSRDRRGASPEDVAFFVWGAQFGFFIQWLASGASQSLVERQRTLGRFLLEGIA